MSGKKSMQVESVSNRILKLVSVSDSSCDIKCEQSKLKLVSVSDSSCDIKCEQSKSKLVSVTDPVI